MLVRLHRSPPRSIPNTVAPPPVGRMSPSSSRIVVLLPAPFGPRYPNTSLLDAQVEVADGDDGVVVGLRETEGLDRRATGHASLSYFRTVG